MNKIKFSLKYAPFWIILDHFLFPRPHQKAGRAFDLRSLLSWTRDSNDCSAKMRSLLLGISLTLLISCQNAGTPWLLCWIDPSSFFQRLFMNVSLTFLFRFGCSRFCIAAAVGNAEIVASYGASQRYEWDSATSSGSTVFRYPAPGPSRVISIEASAEGADQTWTLYATMCFPRDSTWMGQAPSTQAKSCSSATCLLDFIVRFP